MSGDVYIRIANCWGRIGHRLALWVVCDHIPLPELAYLLACTLRIRGLPSGTDAIDGASAQTGRMPGYCDLVSSVYIYGSGLAFPPAN